MCDGFLRTKEILEGYTLHKLEPIDERLYVNQFICKQFNLHAHFVISNRSIYDIIIVRGLLAWIETVSNYELSPFNRVIIEKL